jgi:hypothetical protein
MGKTVWLELLAHAPGDGLAAVMIDYEGVKTAEQFLLRTVEGLQQYRSLPSQTVTKLLAMFDGVQVSGGPITVKAGVATRTPTALIRDTIGSVEEHLEPDTLLVIAMDEVPLAFANIADNEGPAAADLMLQTLRDLRQRKGRLRWIVSGSIGFHHVLRRCGTTEGAINDLINLPLGPMKSAEAQELAHRLLLGISREPEPGAVDALVEQSGCIPFLIHALAHILHDSGTGPVSTDAVAKAFSAFLDERDESKAVTHLLTRLQPLYGDHAESAEAALDRVAIERSVAVDDLALEAEVLDNLIDDHYLREHERALSWRYDVLRRIWVHRRRLDDN